MWRRLDTAVPVAAVRVSDNKVQVKREEMRIKTPLVLPYFQINYINTKHWK
jgi:hypothetical protein